MITKMRSKCVFCWWFSSVYFSVFSGCHGGMLFPKPSESRQIQELDGMWNFRADFSSNRRQGFDDQWFLKPLSKTGPVIDMPVPSSYNDITTDKKLQNFVGWVWYDREFFVSSDWAKKRVVLRVDSAHYNTAVWVNGKAATTHSGGHLPFEVQVNDYLSFDSGVNRVTVAVNNTLTPETLPPGSLTFHTNDKRYPPGYFVQNLQFDFFNYAGIHRRVRLYTTPQNYVDDIDISTLDINQGNTAHVKFDVTAHCEDTCSIQVEAVDADGVTLASSTQNTGVLVMTSPRLWWPYTMNSTDPGYLYTLKVLLKSKSSKDVYRQHFGIRTIKVTESQLLINDRPFYCHGVAKHEDSDIRGKGLDFPLIARDFNMLKWLGVNCFRTSHYPYAEEIMDQADKLGIVVINECPGVGIKKKENFGNVSLSHHLSVMKELVTRDKNRPSVVVWSVANEPESSTDYSAEYFKQVIQYTQKLDPSRPVTFVSNTHYAKDKAAKYTDLQCFNRYYAWYQDTGHLETVAYQLRDDLEGWYTRLNKPLIITEYGADTVPGLHTLPSFVFTEEYQVEFLEAYHSVFDEYRDKYLIGEMVWNFADFMTDQTTTRVVGNKKGLLTRQRQPKAGAHVIRRRYWAMINGTRLHGRDEL